MLCNASYAGYLTGLRDKSRTIKGLHEPIVPEELFDRVQEVRGWRTRVTKPGRPSDDYLLRKLLCCEYCGARMHGTRGGRGGVRLYRCSTRRYRGVCEQTIVAAEPLEEQLIDWLHTFQSDATLRRLIIDTIREKTGSHREDAARRSQLLLQLERLRDLYTMGDLTKAKYVMRRQALEEELQRTKPPTDLDPAPENFYGAAAQSLMQRAHMLTAMGSPTASEHELSERGGPPRPYRPADASHLHDSALRLVAAHDVNEGR